MYNKKNSNYWNVFRGVSLALSVLTLSLAVSYFASAWTEPSVAPPGGNASAPLNVSFTDQSKEGRIGIGGIFAPLYSLDIRDSIGLGTLRTTGGAILNTGGAATGLLVQNGNVGIGTINPGAKLHVLGISNVDTKADNIFVQGISDVASNNPAIEFRRSKGNSYPGNAVVFDDMLGEVIGEGYDGVSWPEAANIRMSVDGPVAAGKVPARFDFLTRDNSGNYSSRMTIKNNGNVGIGTTNPINAKLHVRGDDGIVIDGEGSSSEIKFKDAGTNGIYGDGDDYYFRFNTTGEHDRIKISATASDDNLTPGFGGIATFKRNGWVGIGTTNPTAKLDVRGNVKIGNDPAQANKALCWRADKTIGYCSTQPDATGSCACNAIN